MDVCLGERPKGPVNGALQTTMEEMQARGVSLIAQAFAEGLTVVTHDKRFTAYDVPTLAV